MQFFKCFNKLTPTLCTRFFFFKNYFKFILKYLKRGKQFFKRLLLRLFKKVHVTFFKLVSKNVVKKNSNLWYRYFLHFNFTNKLFLTKKYFSFKYLHKKTAFHGGHVFLSNLIVM